MDRVPHSTAREQLLNDRRIAAACRRYDRTIAAQERDLGPEHPLIAMSLNNLANELRDLDVPAPVRRGLYERSLAILDRAAYPHDLGHAAVLCNLAETYLDQSDTDAERAVELYVCAVDTAHRHRWDAQVLTCALAGLAWAMLQADDEAVAAARPVLEAVLAVQQHELYPDDPRIAGTLAAVATTWSAGTESALTAAGAVEALRHARRLLERALEIQGRSLGEDDPRVAETLQALATTWSDEAWYMHSDEEAGAYLGRARTLLERSLEIHERSSSPDHWRVWSTMDDLVSVLTDVGEHSRAEALDTRAASYLVSDASRGSGAVALIDLTESLLGRAGAWRPIAGTVDRGDTWAGANRRPVRHIGAAARSHACAPFVRLATFLVILALSALLR